MAEQVVAEYKLDVDQAVKGLDKLQAEYAKTEAASRKAAQTSNDSFIKGSDGAKRLDAELRKQPKTLAEMELKLRNLRELLRDDTKIGTEGFKKIRAEIDKTEKEVQKLNGDLKKTGTEMSGLGGTAKKVGGFLAAAFAADRIISFTKEVVTLAAQSEGVERAFARIGSPQLLANLRTATRNTVADLTLMTTAIQASNFKIPLDELATYLKFATQRANETGKSVDYMVESILTGVGRGSIEVWDNLGFSLGEVRQHLNGVAVESLSVGERAKLMSKLVNAELAKMGDQADTTADKIAQFTTKFENLKVVLGKIIAEDSAGVLTFFGNLAQAISDDISELDRFKQSLSGQSGLKLLNILTEERAKLAEMEADATEKAGKVRDAEFNKIQEAVDFQREVVNSIMAELDARIDNNNEIEITNELIDEEIRKYKERQAEGEKYVRSLNQLNKELKDLDKKLKDTEVGSKEFWKILSQLNEKTKELARAMLLLTPEGSISRLNAELSILKSDLDNAKIAGQSFWEIEDKITEKTKELNEAVAMTKLADAFKIDEDEFPDFSGGVIGYAEEVARETDIADKLWEAHFNELMRLQDEEIANRKANQQIALEITQQTLSTMSQMVGSIAQIQQNAFMKEQQELQKQLEQGLITREEFEQKELQIRRKAAAAAKDAAMFQAVINTAQAVMQALANTPPPASYALAAVAGALGAVQIAAIASEPLPQFAEGVIGLKGAGTETSDSIHAKLSKGESVMTAAETKRYNAELWAIRNGNFEDLIITKYVRPMIDETLFNGFGDIAKSAQLNGLTANLKDHNILAAIDRDRQATVYGLNLVAGKLDKLSRTNTRRGW